MYVSIYIYTYILYIYTYIYIYIYIYILYTYIYIEDCEIHETYIIALYINLSIEHSFYSTI